MGKTKEVQHINAFIERWKRLQEKIKEENIKLSTEEVLSGLVDIVEEVEEQVEVLKELDDTPKPKEVKEEVNLVNNYHTFRW